jgi:dynein heavy chain, axonemal
MDVHARDVVAALAKEDIQGQPQHFSWLSQLRMYWESLAAAEPDNKTIAVRMINAQVREGVACFHCALVVGLR